MNRIFLLDTNVLLDWLASYLPGKADREPAWRQETIKAVKAFCEKCPHQFRVPDLVWVEFLSVVQHKDIPVDGDFQQMKLRQRNQQTMIQQMEYAILTHKNWDMFTLETNPFNDAQELLTDDALINKDLFTWMQRAAQRKQQRSGHQGPLQHKLLDGMDSAILIYLNELALQNPKSQVTLLTGDLPLFRVVHRVKEYCHSWYAQNVDSKCTLFEKFRQRTMAKYGAKEN